MQNLKERIDLNNIKSPEDIRKLTPDELGYLAVSIREFLIDKVSKTGGHLASNLGVVELTLGLHYVFDTPRDKIIWDVGHQSYVHKMITGRMAGFDSLRQTAGMSGFPKRKESEYDVYDTGHSSTSLSAALGMAAARDLDGDDNEIIAVIGDGSFTGGPAFEALNNVGNLKSKIIIILNDNEMSISKNIGGLSEHLGKLRTSSGYQNTKEQLKKGLNRIPVVGPSIKSALGNTKDYIKYLVISGGIFFEELGLTYLGPCDGNDIEQVIEALSQAKNADGPVLVHAITKKGKGYTPAEKYPDVFHGVGAFTPETGNQVSSSAPSYSDVFGEAILKLAEGNNKITAITAAMTDATGLGPMAAKFPKRVFDVGIAEAHATIFAAGQAVSGYHPVVAIYSSFLQRAYDEIIEDICLQNLPVTFAIDRAGVVGADGETHHGIFDLSYLIPIPNMSIFAPCDAVQLTEILNYAVDLETPTAIRYPRGKAVTDNLTGSSFDGKNIRISEGKKVDILAVGNMMEVGIKTVEMLQKKGIESGLVDIALVKDGTKCPSLTDYLIDYQDNEKLIVTIEDNIARGGFGNLIAELLEDENRSNKLVTIGWPNKFIEHGDVESLRKKYGLDPESITETIMDALNTDKSSPKKDKDKAEAKRKNN